MSKEQYNLNTNTTSLREINRKPKTEERLKRIRDKEIRKMLGLSRIGRNNV